MANYALQVRGLGKSYQIGKNQEYSTLRDTITQAVTAPFKRAKQIVSGDAYGASNLTETLWALKDLSFDIKHGEVVGIIGHNGAGKSTLLKVLSQITEPTIGEARIYGRIGALLEVGTGFHEELTGRENVILNGAILGMSQYDVNRRFDEIIDFAGVEKFIDTPVKHYSSGMKLRLGFAVAAHLEPEILVVDEVLAVGDAAFQKKCLGKMSDVADSGRTVLFVSHNMAAVENLCSRGIILNRGQVSFDGKTSKAIEHYMLSLQSETTVPLRDRINRRGNGAIRFTDVQLASIDDVPLEFVSSGQTFNIKLGYEVMMPSDVNNVRVGVTCYNQMGVAIFSQHTRLAGKEFIDIPQSGEFVCKIEDLPLPPSTYLLEIVVKANENLADFVQNATQIHVMEGDFLQSGRIPTAKEGLVLIRGDWTLNAPI